MIRTWALFLLAVVSIGAARSAQAVPIALQVDPTGTNLVFGVSSSAGSDTTPFLVSGAVSGELQLVDHGSFGPVVTQLELQSGILDASHQPLSILGAGVSLLFASTDMTASVTGPAVGATPVAPGFSVGDFRDHIAALNGGTFAVVGNVFADPVDESLDLALFPFELILPLNSIGQIRVSGDPGALDVGISIPIDTVMPVFISGLAVDVTLSGTFALTGTIVPEPSTAGLLGMGLAIIAAARRQRHSA